MADIGELRLFVSLVNAGGLSAAGRHLDASPAAMSRRLAALERRLGVRLVTRTSRRFDLTDEGQRFYDRCVGILQELDDAEAEVSAASEQPRGTIKVVAPMGLGAQIIAPLTRLFQERNPHVSVRLILSDAGPYLVDPLPDLLLATRLPASSAMISRKIHSERRIVCATPAYFARRGRPATPADLRQHDCLCLVRGVDVFDTWRFDIEGRQAGIKVKGPLSANSSAVLRDWVLAGHGIGCLAMWDIDDAVQNGVVEECLQDFWCDTIDLYAIYLSRRHLPLRMRAYIDFIAAELGMRQR